MRKINKEDKVTIVIITHDVEKILRYADHVIHIDETIVFDGTKDEYLESAFVKEFKGGAE